MELKRSLPRGVARNERITQLGLRLHSPLSVQIQALVCHAVPLAAQPREGVQHSHPRRPPIVALFHRLHQENLLRNTIVFFFGDHSIRWGPLRQKLIGRYEYILPMMFEAPPREWKGTKIPEISRRVLKVNTLRLTTPFDVHETLEQILLYDKEIIEAKETKGPGSNGTKSNGTEHNEISSKGAYSNNPAPLNRSFSLFTEIPAHRTCEDVFIERHFCACCDYEILPIGPNDIAVKQIVREVIDEMNRRMEIHRKKCFKLRLLRVIDAQWKVRVDDNRLLRDALKDASGSFRDYAVSFQAKPGKGRFEADVRNYFENNTVLLQGEVSRTDAYGSQSQCIKHIVHKKWYFCADDLPPES